MIYQKFIFGGQSLCLQFSFICSKVILWFYSGVFLMSFPLSLRMVLSLFFSFPLTMHRTLSRLIPLLIWCVVMYKFLPPAIPPDSLPADGQRFFLVDGLTSDPFAERIVGHYRKPVKYNLGGQLSLWEHESKKTV